MYSLFLISTILIGVITQSFAGHYLSIQGTFPQVLLLIVVTAGFLVGPIMGVLLGFLLGLFSDSAGIHLFGMNALLLSLTGFICGSLRRRVACERNAAQLVVAIIATLAYSFGGMLVFKMFEESGYRFSFWPLILKILFNLLFVNIVFFLFEQWISFWRIEKEHV